MTQPSEFNPVAGVPYPLAPDLDMVLAPNPSPMTHLGTNTYILGNQSLAVIDPGPDLPAHMTALMLAISGRRVDHILLTHSHLDHSPLARPLAEATGARIYAFGDSAAGRSSIMQQLAADGLAGGGEGIDHDFSPDEYLANGAVLSGDSWELKAIHTPGHIGNHLCFRWGDAIFTGDHVMGWASSLVSPPDGDLTDFMTSCGALQNEEAQVFYPGHGAPIGAPRERLQWLIDHRRGRETSVLSALAKGPCDVPMLTATIYTDIDPTMLPAARRNVFAHLVDLHQRGLVHASPNLATTATFERS